MAYIEKVIKGLEHCAVRHKCNNECPYSNIIQDQNEGMDSCVTQLSKDALELLKDQQPKVLSKEDVAKHDVVWMETNKDEIFPVLVNGATGNPKSKIHYYVHLYGVDGYIVGFPMFLYNRTWRCWTARPTNNVRMNTPWEGR